MADGIVEYVLRLKDQTKRGTSTATAGAKRLEDQTEQTTRAVDQLGDESAQTGRQLDRMGKESSRAARAQAGLSRGMGAAVSGAGRLLSSVGGLGTALGAAGLAGAATAAVVSFRSASQEVADLRNDIADASTRSGIATDTLQGLRLAAEGAGLSFSSLTSGLDQFGRRVSDAAKGGNATADAFAELGVSVTDASGDLRDGDAVLRETLAALNEMEPSAQRSALAVETLGRSGGKLLQALSGSGLDAFVEQARIFGVDIGPKAAASAGEWQRATAELALVFRGLKGAIVDTFGGADLVFGFTDALVFFSAKLGVLASSAPALLGVIEAAADSLGDALSTNLDRVQARAEAVGIVIGAIAEAVADIADQLSQAIASGDPFGFADAVSGLGEAVADGFADGLETARARIARADKAFGDAARGRDAAIDAVPAVVGAVSAGAQATAVDRLVSLRQTRESIRAGGRQGAAPSGGPPGSEGGPEAIATEAAVAASRVFASGFTEDRRRLSDVLAEGVENLADQAAATQQAAAENLARTLRSVTSGIAVGTSVLGGNIGGALSQAGRATGSAGLGVAGAAVSGLQFIGEQGADGIRETLDGVKDGLIAALEALPELIGDVLPEFAVSLISELIPALIEASPEIFRALLLDLPKAIGEAVASAIGVKSDVGRGALRGAGLGAAIGGVAAGVLTLGIGTGAGAAIGASVGGAVGGGVEAVRNRRSSDAARTATDGQRSTARESDRLAQMSTRRRRNRATVRQNPFDAMARQYDAQYGTLGRASSTTIGAS